jgi:hypothetical protein
VLLALLLSVALLAALLERERKEKKVELLRARMLAWTPSLERDLAGFASSDYEGNGAVPDDVVIDCRRVLESVAAAEAGSAVTSYAAELSADVGAALEVADAAVDAARALRVRLNEQQEETRMAALALQHELVAYRRVLLRVVGKAHPDYRALRARERSSAEAVEETVEAETSEGTSAPARIPVLTPTHELAIA